jgi:hypothetical protein
MAWFEAITDFIVAFAGVTAWPLVLFAVAYLFRMEVKRVTDLLARRLTAIGFGSARAEFRGLIEEWREFEPAPDDIARRSGSGDGR